MLTGQDALQQTIAWGVQRGLFACALGDGTDFDTIHFRDTLPAGTFAIVEGAWLLRPTLAEQLLQKEEPEPETPLQPEPFPEPGPGDEAGRPLDVTPQPQPQPVPQPQTYRRPSKPWLIGGNGTTFTRPSSNPWSKPGLRSSLT